MNRKWKK